MYGRYTAGLILNSRKCLRGPHRTSTYIANYILYLTHIFICRGGGIFVNKEPYFDLFNTLIAHTCIIYLPRRWWYPNKLRTIF